MAGEWTPANDFTYLVVSSPALTEGTYTLWSGETQLAGAAGMTGGMGGGPRPDGGKPPEGMTPPEGDPSQKPERPQPNKDGTMALPDSTIVDPADIKRPENGERPELPEGFGGRPEDMKATEVSTDFVLTSEGGTFGNIAPAE